jgi:hypothetical protein
MVDAMRAGAGGRRRNVDVHGARSVVAVAPADPHEDDGTDDERRRDRPKVTLPAAKDLYQWARGDLNPHVR